MGFKKILSLFKMFLSKHGTGFPASIGFLPIRVKSGKPRVWLQPSNTIIGCLWTEEGMWALGPPSLALPKGAAEWRPGRWNVLLPHNHKQHEIESSGKGEEGEAAGATGLLPRCSIMTALTAKCLCYPLRPQLDCVTHCWPPLSPAVTFNSIFVRHHEAKGKARGVNHAFVYSSVFWFKCFFLPSLRCALSQALLAKGVALPENLVAPAASEQRCFEQSPEEANGPTACLSRFYLASIC